MEKQLTKKDLNKLFWRLQSVRVTLNYETMQAPGFMRAIAPVLQKFYPDKEDLAEAMKRHNTFYNSHVVGNAIILGISAAMEEITTTPEDKEGVIALKTGLMGPLAGIGDSLLKFTWVPIIGSIGASLALNGSILGPILMFVLFNIVNMGGKYFGLVYGYEKGIDFFTKTEDNTIIQRISSMANVVGLMVVGSMIASSVKINTILEISAGENVIQLQEMLDTIMPNFLGLLVTIIVYNVLKKTSGKHSALIIISIMAISVLLKYLGVI
ncbi:PTS system mannose/fructose/sorbose family transporter subunit IID [Vagococcus elongatus]|uniref:PTS mannose transporter subunit IID n=1 Tax=Vagococcus elongatus TaxID=180344 RepID=A0A430AZM3_9ENTE|nr:PTS system mannose/fructose/sorbose family transporter subunit IID [Vagococcus elongatus]RSU13504.1 PTS mannose transporter subunit IID [Vagococcus elongatus]